jgi:hypothetical protein
MEERQAFVTHVNAIARSRLHRPLAVTGVADGCCESRKRHWKILQRCVIASQALRQPEEGSPPRRSPTEQARGLCLQLQHPYLPPTSNHISSPIRDVSELCHCRGCPPSQPMVIDPQTKLWPGSSNRRSTLFRSCWIHQRQHRHFREASGGIISLC